MVLHDERLGSLASWSPRSLRGGAGRPGAGKIGICFSPLTAGREAVPLAQACVPEWRKQEPIIGGHFSRLFHGAADLWERAPMDRARVAVFTDWYTGGPEADAFAMRARRAGIPCLFFDPSDYHTPRNPAYGTVYRCAILRSKMTPAERALPPVYEDMLAMREGRPQPREYRERAVVGFCGYVPGMWKSMAQLLRGQRDKSIGHSVRQRAIGALSRSWAVDTNFVIRRSYWGGAVKAVNNKELLARVRREFVDNMFDCDYVLCVRGAGNFSFRFYEALSAGRIPLLIDTECCLPLPDRIDWREHCVVVDEKRIREAPEIVAEFHRRLGADGFAALQAANLQLSEKLLNPLSFHKIVVEAAAAVEPAAAVA